jgi:hypothetical protein
MKKSTTSINGKGLTKNSTLANFNSPDKIAPKTPKEISRTPTQGNLKTTKNEDNSSKRIY